MKPEKYVERFHQKNLRGNKSGFPIATIAYYGPDDTQTKTGASVERKTRVRVCNIYNLNRTATKVAVGIVDENEEVIDLKRWFKKRY